MGYVGIQGQISRNNFRSVLLLLLFPTIILAIVWVGIALFCVMVTDSKTFDFETVNYFFLQWLPWVVGIVGIWFIIAYFYNSSIVERSVGARPLTRQENMRVYNITENLAMSAGMEMPKLYVVDDPMLNAFASGINDKSYAVTVTTGLLNTLDDRELAGVIAHELTHIRNRDTRLLITSIVFVGIISTAMTIVWRSIWAMSRTTNRRSNNKNGNGGIIIALFIAVICLAIGWFFTSLTRFAMSRKREFMADAGSAEMTGDPWGLASALRKISGAPGLGKAGDKSVAQLFIALPATSKMKSLFATHPDINRRIEILEQF